ncbi:MAG: hypothetical protein AABX38_01120 [Candidatus Micrarchaeota archaeon]
MDSIRRRHTHRTPRPNTTVVEESSGPKSLAVFWRIMPLKSDPITLSKTGIVGKLEFGFHIEHNNLDSIWRFYLRLESTIKSVRAAKRRLIFSIKDAVILSLSKIAEIDFIHSDYRKSYHYLDLDLAARTSPLVFFNVLTILAKIKQQTRKYNGQELLASNHDGVNSPPNQGMVYLSSEELGLISANDQI